MVDLCRKCRYFHEEYEEPPGIGETIPQKGGSTPKFPPKYICELGHRQTKNKDGRIVPFKHGCICNDFTAK